MSDNKMLVLADKLKELRDQKSDVQASLKAIQDKIDEIQAELISVMTTEECGAFKRNGMTFSLVIKEYPGAIPETKEALYEAMKEHGFEHLFTIPTNTLSATVKELKANNDDIMPDWLSDFISVYEETGIRVTKSK